MRVLNQRAIALGMLAASVPAGVLAQAQELPPADLSTSIAPPSAEPAALLKGPDIKGFISRRSADRMEITADDGSKSIVNINDYTKIRSSKGLFGMSRQQLAANALLNGLPVTVRTLQSGDALMASDIMFKDKDLKIATMIRTGTKQGFDLVITRRISEAVGVSVVASGGAGNLQHLADVLKEGRADAVLAASIFHFGTHTIREAKSFLAAQGITVRLCVER
jgi:hypothetical protein